MTDPIWLALARRNRGERETLAPNDSPFIRQMWAKVHGTWLLGQPYCGGALAYWMCLAGIAYPKAYYRARAWLDWGVRIAEPCYGCIVIFDRAGGGHVGIVVGITMDGRLMVFGANQKNRIDIDPFETDRVLGYRMPTEYARNQRQALPLLASSGPVSRNEV